MRFIHFKMHKCTHTHTHIHRYIIYIYTYCIFIFIFIFILIFILIYIYTHSTDWIWLNEISNRLSRSMSRLWNNSIDVPFFMVSSRLRTHQKVIAVVDHRQQTDAGWLGAVPFARLKHHLSSEQQWTPTIFINFSGDLSSFLYCWGDGDLLGYMASYKFI